MIYKCVNAVQLDIVVSNLMKFGMLGVLSLLRAGLSLGEMMKMACMILMGQFEWDTNSQIY